MPVNTPTDSPAKFNQAKEIFETSSPGNISSRLLRVIRTRVKSFLNYFAQHRIESVTAKGKNRWNLRTYLQKVLANFNRLLPCFLLNNFIIKRNATAGTFRVTLSICNECNHVMYANSIDERN